jgi:hypothetical protein
MIKSILLGIWISGVTLGACYGAIVWDAGRTATEEKKDKLFGKLEQVKTKTISVPVISDGAIQGYVVASFAFAVESDILKKMTISADTILLDEAFRVLYNGDMLHFKTMTKGDLDKSAKQIAENVNKRFGREFVYDVLIQELNFVPKEQARGGPKP